MQKTEDKQNDELTLRTGLVALAILIGLGLLIFGGWSLLRSDDSKKPAQQPVAQQEPDVAAAAVPSGWATYGDKNSDITFAYPADWKINKISDKLKTAGSTRVASLETPDGTSISISLIRSPAGQKTHTSLDDWKNKASQAGIEYTDLATVPSPYTSFGYTWNSQGMPVLSYEILGSATSASMTVLPAAPPQKAAIEQIVGTVRF